MGEDDGDLGLGDIGLMLPRLSSPIRTPRKASLMRRSSSANHTLQRSTSQSPPQLKNAIAFPSTALDAMALTGLTRWIVCFAVCNFDLDKGPDLDSVYPPTKFTATEHGDIAFASMPDTASSQATGTAFSHFSWRLPAHLSTTAEGTTADYLLGYVCFMQQKNAAAARGFVQRSIVLITRLAEFSGLFASLMVSLGPAYMREETEGSKLIEVACRNISRWPAPTAGSVVELPFLGKLLSVDIPLAGQAQYQDLRSPLHPSRVPRMTLLATCPLTPISLLLQNSLDKLWLLWELVVTAEPLLVYAPGDPTTASEIVTWLVTLIRPLPYGGDWRPLLTLQQSDHAALLKQTKPASGLLVGVTSPLIFSNCRTFPHVMRASSATGSEVAAPVFNPGHAKSDSSQSFREAQDAAQGLFSDRRRMVVRDEEVLKAAELKTKSGDYLSADAILIRHFTDLTERLLVPLNRHFARIQPQSSPGVASVVHAPTFEMHQFRESLKMYNSPLKLRRAPIARSPGGRSQMVQLYERFVKGRHFGSWLRGRTQASLAVEKERARQISRRFDDKNRFNHADLFLEREAGVRSRSMDSGRRRLPDDSDARSIVSENGLNAFQDEGDTEGSSVPPRRNSSHLALPPIHGH